jgi:nicotinate-nucleotide adenylyltransferase
VIRPPPFGHGQRIGLFGGSFNPAHRGHYMVALYALKRLQLDWVWWLVSPQNPLKDARVTGEYGERLRQTCAIARHPRFKVTDLEKRANAHNTAATLEALAPYLKRARFVWIMGADSFADLHRWHHWLDIPATLPLACLARPGYSIRALHSRAAISFDDSRVRSDRAAHLPGERPPAWVFLQMPLRPESSSAIRALKGAGRSLRLSTSSQQEPVI